MIGPEFTIETGTHDGSPMLVVSGELDLASGPDLREAAADAGTPLILDVRDVAFIDSVGLRSLLQVRELVGQEHLLLIAPEDGAVVRLLELTRLTDSFSVQPERP